MIVSMLSIAQLSRHCTLCKCEPAHCRLVGGTLSLSSGSRGPVRANCDHICACWFHPPTVVSKRDYLGAVEAKTRASIGPKSMPSLLVK